MTESRARGTPILLRPLQALGRVLGAGDAAPGIAASAGLAMVVSLATLVGVASDAPVRNNPASRIGTIETLVDHEDWSLDEATHRYVTTDKVWVGGRFYSSKPPVYNVVGAVVYSLVRDLRGQTLAEDPQGTVFWLRMAMQILPFLMGLVLAGRLLRTFVSDDWVWLWGVIAFALGTFVFGYSADINNHSLAAVLVLGAMAGGLSLARGNNGAWLWLGTGFCAALAVTIDFGAGVFALALGAFVLWRARRWGLAWFALGAELPVLVHVHLTVRVAGSVRPFYAQQGLYDYPGSYWLRRANFDALDEPAWVYAFHALIGHHGLFAMTPLFLLAIPGMVALVRSPSQRSVGAWLGISVVVTVLVYLLAGPGNYGGTAQGMRWFIILAPMLWLMALLWAETRAKSRWVRWGLPVLVLLGVVTALQAIGNPWTVSPWNWLLRDLGLGSVEPWRRLLPG